MILLRITVLDQLSMVNETKEKEHETRLKPKLLNDSLNEQLAFL